MLSTTQQSCKTLQDLLLDLHSTPIGFNMAPPWEILHSRNFQHPGKPTTPVNMEQVHNYLLLKKEMQKTHFDRAHGARELQELSPSQEVLFWSLAEDEFIPGTIVDKAIPPCSYIIEVEGKCFHKTREHIRPIHLNIPVPSTSEQFPMHSAKTLQPSHIPKPNPHHKSVPQPKKYLPIPSLCPFSCIPRLAPTTFPAWALS